MLKTKKVWVLALVVMLITAFASAAFADTVINLNGVLEPSGEISVSVTNTSLSYTITSGQTWSEAQPIEVVNATEVSIQIKVAGMTVDTDVWNGLTMVNSNNLGDNYWERTKRAAFDLRPTDGDNWKTKPDNWFYCPDMNGEGRQSLTIFNYRPDGWAGWQTEGLKNVSFNMGVINPKVSETSPAVVINTFLGSHVNRAAKNFAGTLTLNFSAVD